VAPRDFLANFRDQTQIESESFRADFPDGSIRQLRPLSPSTSAARAAQPPEQIGPSRP
jgi:hypothetical protein